ncbi:tail fiber assembly protein [Kluyvera ascorbata]|uniref:tail fiber assembly protein n=1 Tax=Kluyvera ascorbata TaxID=51288 RepID=UPI0039F73B13
MKYFKDDKNAVYAYEDDVDTKYVKSGLTEISEADALALANPAPNQEQLIAQAVSRKNQLRSVADDEIAWLQDAVDAEIATDEETALLAAWKNYRVQLMRIDTSKAPDIEWPIPPEV